MTRAELMAIGMYAEMLRLQPAPSLALTLEQRRELKDLLLKWCREEGIEIPLGASSGEVETAPSPGENPPGPEISTQQALGNAFEVAAIKLRDHARMRRFLLLPWPWRRRHRN